jgi:hypothetical protein
MIYIPHGYMKIRHYGILSSRNKPKLKALQITLGIDREEAPTDYKHITLTKLGYDIVQCPCCKSGKMVRLLNFSANAPPTAHKTVLTC